MPLTSAEKCRRWRERHPEKARACDRRQYVRNREKILARKKAWREANPEEAAARDRANREKYREQRSEYTKQWVADNRTKKNERTARRHARKVGATVEPVDRAEIVLRDGRTCYLCGVDCTDWTGTRLPTDLTLDHVVPLAAGGAHSPDNLRVACLNCNARKGSKLLPSATVEPATA